MTESIHYLLSWILRFKVPVAVWSGDIGIFLLGLVSSLLLFFAARDMYVLISGRKGRPWRAFEKSMAAALIAVPFAILDLGISVLPLSGPVFLPEMYLAALVALSVFEVCFFFTIYFSARHIKAGRAFFVCLLLAGLLYPPAVFFFSLPSYFFPGIFSFLMSLMGLFFALKQKKQRKEYRHFLIDSALNLILALSFFVPFAEPQIVLRAFPFLLTLGCWKSMLYRRADIEISDVEKPEFSDAEEVPAAQMPAPLVSSAEAAVPSRQDTAKETVSAPDAGEYAAISGPAENLEELEPADDGLLYLSGENRIASYKMNTFIPQEFLRLLKKKTVMDLKLGDHLKQEMTIFFSDIRQFTELFESLSPEEGFKFINSYLTRIVPLIEQFGGFVDKYIGDAIMALFPQSNGADMAVRAAIEIQTRIHEYNNHRAKCGYRPLDIGVGIHTGTLILGVVGVHNRMQNTVISDAVNLASRVEGLTKAFGVSMAISGQTFQNLEHPEEYMFRYLGNVKVKGKGEPTRVYEILNGIDREILEKKRKTNTLFEQGLFCFVQKKYAEALGYFTRVLDILPDDLAANIYMRHCMEKLDALPVPRRKG
jgi:two-component system sensor histidine kinase ChiS